MKNTKKRASRTSTEKFLSQPPRALPGGIYCSPWCGFNCKKADHDRAHDDGARHARKLGKGWQFEVWENCGWHYKLTKGKVEIYPAGHNFTAFLQTAPQVVSGPRKTPLAALREVVGLVHEMTDLFTKEIGKVSGDAL